MVLYALIGKRAKKTIERRLNKMEETYGEDVVQSVVNRHMRIKKERKESQKSIDYHTKKLAGLKQGLVQKK